MHLKVNLFLFWKIGNLVFARQDYYENIVLKISEYLSYKFGMSETFSVSNINYMSNFYRCFPIYCDDFEKLTFEHYKLLVNVNVVGERYFYFQLALFCRSSVEDLNKMISNNLYLYI